MAQELLPLVQSPPERRRGRPPGAKNKRSSDLARYVEAMFGGMTPGQQAAELALVKPADIRRAREAARELGIVDLDLPPLMLAMVVKATRLAKALGIEKADAWLLLQRERADLMGYIHQKQAPAQAPKDAPALPTVFMIPDGQAVELAELGDDEGDGLEILGVSPPAATKVAPRKSRDDT